MRLQHIIEHTQLHFLRPGELRGSWRDSELRKLGFRQAENGSWFIPLTRWRQLEQLGETEWRSLLEASAVDIPRDQMPQISAQDLSDSHRTVSTQMPIHLLVPVQSERVPGLVRRATERIQQGRTEPLVVDCDRRIVNGHHRYDAYQQLGYHSVPVIQVLDADVHQLCDLYRDTTEAALVEAEQLLSQVNERTEVYVDMDGVLADFFGEWARLAGVPDHRDIKDPESALALVRNADDFWLNLPKTSHADRLLDMVISAAGSYKILSTPLADDARSGPHKVKWVKQNLQGRLPDKVILSHNKAQYATQPDGTPNILIDDYGVNIRKWEAAGGIGFKHKDHKFDRTAKNIQQHLHGTDMSEGNRAQLGIPANATLAQLDQIRSSNTASPEKKKRAHWLANMRRGHNRNK